MDGSRDAAGMTSSTSKIDSETFRELALAELDSVYRMAFHLARGPEDAAELTQETFVRALRAEHQFELREKGIRPWLFKILHNLFYSRLDRKTREPTLVEDLQHELAPNELDQPPPAWDLSMLDWEQVDERLKWAIDELADPYREVLLLWAIEGLKYREIAEVVGVPMGTVMSRLYRARSILSEKLAQLAAEHGIHGGDGSAWKGDSEQARTEASPSHGGGR